MAEGGKDLDLNMDLEREREREREVIEEASKGISAEELEMIKTLHALGFEPRHGSI